MKGLQPVEVSEKGTVTFEVELSHEDVEGTWQKDGVRLKPAPNIIMDVQGKKHSLTLSSVTLEDAGLISFKADGIHSSGRLTVTGTLTPKSKALFGVGHGYLLLSPESKPLRGQPTFLISNISLKYQQDYCNIIVPSTCHDNVFKTIGFGGLFSLRSYIKHRK